MIALALEDLVARDGARVDTPMIPIRVVVRDAFAARDVGGVEVPVVVIPLEEGPFVSVGHGQLFGRSAVAVGGR